MATIEYSLSSKKDKTTGKQEILVRFFHGRFNQRGKTNLYGHSDDWDQGRQRFVIPKVRMMTEEKRKEIQELQNLNSELDAISRYLLDAFVFLFLNNQHASFKRNLKPYVSMISFLYQLFLANH